MKPGQAYYVLECHEHGWLLCIAPGQSGVPPGALAECLSLLPKGTVANDKIARGLNLQGYRAHVFVALGLPQALDAWGKQVEGCLRLLQEATRFRAGVAAPIVRGGRGLPCYRVARDHRTLGRTGRGDQ